MKVIININIKINNDIKDFPPDVNIEKKNDESFNNKKISLIMPFKIKNRNMTAANIPNPNNI